MNPKNKYLVVLRCMHGDADKYEDVKLYITAPAAFEKAMRAKATQPLDGSAGGNEKAYVKWITENFGEDSVPRDCIYSTTGHRAKVEDIKGFFYDANGVKWKAEVTDL
jgi:hypothetical protein